MFGISGAYGGNAYNASYLKRLYGSSSAGGISKQYDYADKNTQKLLEIVQNRVQNQQKASTALQNYRKEATSFYADFYPSMDKLKTSASNLKNTSLSSAMDQIASGSSTSDAVIQLDGTGELSKQTADPSVVLKSVKQFATSYNRVLDVLGKHASKSDGISNLSNSFEDVGRAASSSLSSIGIGVDSSGRLSVNDDRFNAAFRENPDRVKEMLGGSEGLAADAYRKASDAVIQSQKLMQPPRSIGMGVSSGANIGVLLDMLV